MVKHTSKVPIVTAAIHAKVLQNYFSKTSQQKDAFTATVVIMGAAIRSVMLENYDAIK